MHCQSDLAICNIRQNFNTFPFNLQKRKKHWVSLPARHLTQKCCKLSFWVLFCLCQTPTLPATSADYGKSWPFHRETCRAQSSGFPDTTGHFMCLIWNTLKMPHFRHLLSEKEVDLQVLLKKKKKTKKNRHAKLYQRMLIQVLWLR